MRQTVIKELAEKCSGSADGNIILVDDLYYLAKNSNDHDFYLAVLDIVKELIYAIHPIVITNPYKPTEPPKQFYLARDAADYLYEQFDPNEDTVGEFLASFTIDARLDDAEDIVLALRHVFDFWRRRELMRGAHGV